MTQTSETIETIGTQEATERFAGNSAAKIEVAVSTSLYNPTFEGELSNLHLTYQDESFRIIKTPEELRYQQPQISDLYSDVNTYRTFARETYERLHWLSWIKKGDIQSYVGADLHSFALFEREMYALSVLKPRHEFEHKENDIYSSIFGYVHGFRESMGMIARMVGSHEIPDVRSTSNPFLDGIDS